MQFINKIIILSVFAVFLQLGVCAQSFTKNGIDQRIITAFGNDYVTRMQTDSPQRLQYLDFFLHHSYYITDLPSGKPHPDVSTITDKNGVAGNVIINLTDLTSFNPLLFNITRNQTSKTFYKVGNTGKMIVFYANREFLKKYNETRH